MNITIYREAYKWLFSKHIERVECLWSFGRYRPACEIGDDLLFRVDDVVEGRAICRQVFKPGERNCAMFDGSRLLTGWKVMWAQADFEDLRESGLPSKFGLPLTKRMDEVLRDHDSKGVISYKWTPTHVASLVERGLVSAVKGSPRAGLFSTLDSYQLNAEGWRVVRREVNEARRKDIEAGLIACRICGCTENDACNPPCEWAKEALCSSCAPLIKPIRQRKAVVAS